MDYYTGNAELKRVIDSISAGQFSNGNRDVFTPIVDSWLYHDEFLVLADFQAYLECQARAAEAYRDTEAWTRMSILNVARCGFFSSDRSMRQYCQEIWGVKPVPVEE
jgi:starch phosphorylase